MLIPVHTWQRQIFCINDKRAFEWQYWQIDLLGIQHIYKFVGELVYSSYCFFLSLLYESINYKYQFHKKTVIKKRQRRKTGLKSKLFPKTALVRL